MHAHRALNILVILLLLTPLLLAGQPARAAVETRRAAGMEVGPPSPAAAGPRPQRERAPAPKPPTQARPASEPPAKTPSLAPQAAWTTEEIDPWTTMWRIGEHSVLDDAGRPHLVYVLGYGDLHGWDEGIYYSWFDGTAWQRELVERMADWSANGFSFGLDSLGRPHLAYSKEGPNGEHALRYAYQDAGTWVIQTVDTLSTNHTRCSFALDANDHPHISYNDEVYDGHTHYVLKYAAYDGASWRIETVDSQKEDGAMGWRNSLALDSAGRPRIAYQSIRSNASYLRYAFYDGTAWFTETVDIGGEGISLALDQSGRPHISYLAYDSQNFLRYAWNDGTSWLTTTVVAGPFVDNTSLGLDAAGLPHIAFFDSSYRPTYGRWDGTGWQIETLDQEPADSVGTISLVLDALGHPRVFYRGEYRWSLEYTYYDGSSWRTEPVALAGDRGRYSSLAMDSSDSPHVAYCLKNERPDHQDPFPCRALKYAWADGSAWQSVLVDADGDAGDGASLALDAEGRPHISYITQYPDRADLKHAYYNGAAWRIETVHPDIGSSGGLVTSLALDSAGRPHIAYYADQQSDVALRYAYYDGSGWISTTVDTISPCSWSWSCWIRLAMDGNDHAHIAYQGSSAFIRYAYNDGSAWTTMDVGDKEDWSEFSLALDSTGRPHIVYQYEDELLYASYDGSQWSSTEVTDAQAAVVSLAIDSADRPRIAYVTNPPNTYLALLTYIAFDGTRWLSETLASESTLSLAEGMQLALSLDSRGQAAIAYHFDSCIGLLYAHQGCTPLDALSISGPSSLPVGRTHVFTASYLPLTATLPVELLWDNGTSGPTAAYSWTAPGLYTVSVTAANSCGQATAVHTVTVLASCDPVTATDFTWEPLTPTVGSLLTLTAEAWADGWFSETIEMGVNDYWNSLAVDSAGWPHLAYYDGATRAVRYAWKDNVGWHAQAVTGDMGQGSGFCTLALDSLGLPHISYYNAGDNSIEYASYDGVAWQIEVVMHPDPAAMGPVSLKLDSQDLPRISFTTTSEGAGSSVYYLHYDGSWQWEVVDSGADHYWSSLALDPAGRPHISYVSCTSSCSNGDLWYAYHDGADWQRQLVDSFGNIAAWHSLVLDVLGLPHLTYLSFYSSEIHLQYASLDGANWMTQTLSTDPQQDTPSLALDPGGYPHIAYVGYEGQNSVMRYTYYDGAAWHREIADLPSPYMVPSLVVGADGRRYLAYSGYGARYAEWPGGAPTPPITYTRSFGDGALGFGETISHTYTTPGVYTVTLTAANACGQATAVHPITVLPPSVDSLDVVALLAFDNDLSPYAPEVLERFRLGTAANPAARVTLLLDRREDGDSEVVEIADGVITRTGAIPWLPGIHELDTASPEVLRDFVLWARRPGVPTVLALLGHGTGPSPEVDPGPSPAGIHSQLPPLPQFRDRTSGDVTSGTYLSTPELGRALREATDNGANPLTLLFLDQCFEANLDVLYEVKEAAQEVVASPNYAWAAFSYDAYLPHLTAAATPEEMAQAIAVEYEASLDEEHPNAILWVAGASVGPLGDAVSALGDALQGELGNPGPVLAAALAGRYADTTLCRGDLELCPPDELVGLGAFSRELQARYPVGSPVYEAAGAVLLQLGAVHGEYRVGHPWVKPEVTWAYTDVLTVLAPLTPTLGAEEVWRASVYTSTAPLVAVWAPAPTRTVTVTTALRYTVEGRWDDFLSAWYGGLTPTVGLVCRATPPALVYAGMPTMTLLVQPRGLGSWLQWSAHPGAATYAIYVLRPDGTTWELLEVVGGDQTTYRHVEELMPSGEYVYLVSARDERARVLNLTGKVGQWLGITAVEPNWGYQDEATVVWVYGTGFVEPVTVTLDEHEMVVGQVISGQAVVITVPAGLPLGWYDVGVRTEEGEAVAYKAYQVVARPEYWAYLPLVVKR